MSRPFFIAALLGCLLGFIVTFGTIYLRWKPSAQTAKEVAPPMPLVAKDWDFWTLESGSLSEELLKERQALRDKTKDLDIWQKQLAAEKVELVRIREQTEAIREEINKTVVTLMEAEKPNLKALARSYTIMKPPKAVAIFQKTNDDIIVKILALMKPDTVAAILAEMAVSETPNQPADETTGSARAARITEMLRLLHQENQKATPTP